MNSVTYTQEDIKEFSIWLSMAIEPNDEQEAVENFIDLTLFVPLPLLKVASGRLDRTQKAKLKRITDGLI
jgi:hypothetical protein